MCGSTLLRGSPILAGAMSLSPRGRFRRPLLSNLSSRTSKPLFDLDRFFQERQNGIQRVVVSRVDK